MGSFGPNRALYQKVSLCFTSVLVLPLYVIFIFVVDRGIPLGAAPPPKGSFLPLFNPTLRLSEGM